MKKIFVMLFLFSFLVGCESINNSPTKRVEELLNKYQTLDEKLISDLHYSIESNELNEEQKLTYRSIMKRQYQDLTYIIKNEEIDGDNATVKVEIEVYDFNKSNKEAENYLTLHQEEFLTDGNLDKSKYIDYKLSLMEDNNERVKYTLDLTLTKKNKKWVLDDLSDMDREKIHGLYDN
jgi:hypothetical protein